MNPIFDYFVKLYHIGFYDSKDSKFRFFRGFGNKPFIGIPLFLWMFFPLLILLVIITWFDLRIFIGTIIWLIVSFISGKLVIKLYYK